MSTGLFVCGNLNEVRGMTSRHQLETAIKLIDDLVIFDFYTSGKINRFADNIGDCKVVKLDIGKCKNWTEVRDMYKVALVDNKIETMVTLVNTMMSGFRCDDMSLMNTFRKELKAGNNKYTWTFNSIKTLCSRFYLMAVARSVGCENLYHYITDPQEADLSVLGFDTFKKLYILNKEPDLEYIPLYEYGLYQNRQTCDKITDFSFYCTALTPDRKYITEVKEQLESTPGWDVGITSKKRVNKEVEEGKFLPQREYHRKLAEAKYTLVIPSYDITTFSPIRFIEAMVNDCLPFVFHTVVLKDLEITFPNIAKIVKEHLVVDSFDHIRGNISEWSDQKRIDLVKAIQDTKEWKAFTNIDYLKNKWAKLKGVKVK